MSEQNSLDRDTPDRANKGTGYLTDAELACLRARTTSGDTLLVRALYELCTRRAEGVQKHAELVKALDPATQLMRINAQMFEGTLRVLGSQNTALHEEIAKMRVENAELRLENAKLLQRCLVA